MNSICLTFDIDWAPDEVIENTLELLTEYNLNATIFATHKTDILNNLPENIEIGIHPNFSNIIKAEDEIKKLKDIYPQAVSLRSHSKTNSSRISQKEKW